MPASSGFRPAVAALLAVPAYAAALCAAAPPAGAVDRTLGADVPKPAATGAPWTDAEVGRVTANVDALLAGAPALRGAHVGILAVDARDGRVVYARGADDEFQPASTFKLLAGSTSLDKLGRDFRFRTAVLADGRVANGVLRGNLILRGGGDPFLNEKDLENAADAVIAAGIRSVDGDVAVDDGHFETPGYLPGWNWDDFPYYYAPVVSALTFEENVVHLTIAPGPSAGAPARVTALPYAHVSAPGTACAPTADVHVVPSVMTGAPGAKDTVDVARDRAGCILVTGTIAAGAKPDEVAAAVPSPDAYARAAFLAALRARGFAGTDAACADCAFPGEDEHRLRGALSPAATVVWSHDSEPLGDVLADLWLPSDNLVAELLLRQIGVAQDGAPGTTEHGAAWERTWLRRIGVDPATVAIDDGSGLSTYDRITPRALVAVLAHDWNGPNRDLVLDDLPIAGVRGSLRSSFRGSAAERHVFAKTGSISHVSTLAGYAANAKHGALIFAFQVDDWLGSADDLRALRARVLSQFVTG